jgi:cell division transport system permease protein
VNAWLHAHGAALGNALAQARRAPFATVLSVGVLALALALPLVGFVVAAGLARVAAQFDADPQISVFLLPEATVRDRQALEKTLRSRPTIKRLRVVTKEQALAELQATEGVRDLLAGLPGNPLPDTLVVTPVDPGHAAVDALQAELLRLPGVASVQVDSAWVERLERIFDTVQVLTLALAAMLGVAVVAVTFNTIRLQVLTRAAELEVAALFGATRAWLRRPFLHYGVLQGIAAGLLSVGIATGFVAMLVRGFPGGSAALLAPGGIANVPSELAFTAVLVSASLGWLGAWLSVLEHVGPRRSTRSSRVGSAADWRST